jgi:hypothetical protein
MQLTSSVENAADDQQPSTPKLGLKYDQNWFGLVLLLPIEIQDRPPLPTCQTDSGGGSVSVQRKCTSAK